MKKLYDFNIALFVVLLALDTRSDVFPTSGWASDALSLWAIFTALSALGYLFLADTYTATDTDTSDPSQRR